MLNHPRPFGLRTLLSFVAMVLFVSACDTTSSADTTPPGPVTSLAALAGDGTVTLTWTDPSATDLAIVRIQWTPDVASVDVVAGVQSYVATGLTNGTEYTFSLVAADAAGNPSTAVVATATPLGVTANHPGCVPYAPTVLGRPIGGAWQTIGEEAEESFMTPADPGGGYIKLTLGTDAPAIPWLGVTVDPSWVTVIKNGSAAQQDNEQVRSYAFEVGPSRSYLARWNEFFGALPEDHPWPYEGSWTFESRVDCFEPNDTPVDAASIAFDTPVEAYVIAGFRDTYYISSDQDAWDDWYAFTIDVDRPVRLELRAAPANVQMRVQLYDAAGVTLLDDETAAAAGATFDIELVNGANLVAGTYLLKVLPYIGPFRVADLGRDEAIPAHFDEPYELVISLP